VDADVALPGGIPDCGDTVTIYLKADEAGERVAELRFEGRGCTISQAAASLLAEELQGAPLAEVLAMEDASLFELIGAEVARARPRCATLALHTLQSAVHVYQRARR
jgi:nitrogen fixation NifU-like protein